MTYPVGQTITTANVSSVDSSPALARVDILNLITLVNQLVASANEPLGAAVLDGSGVLDGEYLPGTLVKVGDIAFQPSSKIVKIQDVLRLQQRLTADNSQLTAATAGDMIFLTDGDAGQPCLAVHDGGQFRVVRLATAVGDVGAALTVTSTLTATAVP